MALLFAVAPRLAYLPRGEPIAPRCTKHRREILYLYISDNGRLPMPGVVGVAVHVSRSFVVYVGRREYTVSVQNKENKKNESIKRKIPIARSELSKRFRIFATLRGPSDSLVVQIESVIADSVGQNRQFNQRVESQGSSLCCLYP